MKTYLSLLAVLALSGGVTVANTGEPLVPTEAHLFVQPLEEGSITGGEVTAALLQGKAVRFLGCGSETVPADPTEIDKYVEKNCVHSSEMGLQSKLYYQRDSGRFLFLATGVVGSDSTDIDKPIFQFASAIAISGVFYVKKPETIQVVFSYMTYFSGANAEIKTHRSTLLRIAHATIQYPEIKELAIEQ